MKQGRAFARLFCCNEMTKLNNCLRTSAILLKNGHPFGFRLDFVYNRKKARGGNYVKEEENHTECL